jgi:hypothetical protein
VRTVVDLHHHRLLVRDGRAVHVTLGVAVEASGGERDAGRGVLVAS